MKSIKELILFTVFAMIFCNNYVFGQTADEIMAKVDTRVVPKDTRTFMKMNLIDSKNTVRQKDLKTYKLSDEKTMMWFLSPADVKGSCFFKISHDDKDDDMWIYLPALGKVRRIASSATNGSFMGSDFTYEDMGDRKLKDYTYKLLKEEASSGKECWVIECMPNTGVSTDYSKIISWIWKDDYFALKEEFYDKKGKLKKIKTSELTKVKTYWIPQKILMDDLSAKHKTEMVFDKTEVDTGLDPKIFDQNNMTKIY